MQCTRCGSVVADTTPVCPACGNALASVDSYGATSFAPVMPSPQPVAHISVRNATAPLDAFSAASTMMASSSPVPPTMMSNTPHPSPNPNAAQSPRYVVTPAHGSPQPPPQPSHVPTMQSAAPLAPQTSPSNPLPQYGPPPQPMAYGPPYPMMLQQPMQPMQTQGTPGLAVASLVCGLLGLVPFWIGFILCLLAIIFGGIVLSQTRPGQPGRGLALTGLIFGLVFLLPAACGL